MKKHIPNFLTCCNLLCGCLGIYVLSLHSENSLYLAAYLIFFACIFDFLDGFAARILNVTSPIGKELDSLADVVTFGVLPSFIILDLLNHAMDHELLTLAVSAEEEETIFIFLPIISFLIAIFSAIRLAKFNVDTRQSDSFLGVPTPANAILIASLPLIYTHTESMFILDIIINPLFLIGLTIVMSILLVVELPLFSLKFKDFSWANNKTRYIFLAASAALLGILNFLAIPVIIFLYIILSAVDHFILNKTIKVA
jgi:CDP-diacylglycerol--serine O-phosphatidyltransferase